MAYIFVPLAFLIIGYSIIYFAAEPFVNMVSSIWQMVQLSQPIDDSDEYESVFSGSSVFGGTVTSKKNKQKRM